MRNTNDYTNLVDAHEEQTREDYEEEEISYDMNENIIYEE